MSGVNVQKVQKVREVDIPPDVDDDDKLKKKANIYEFMLHEHTLTALCCAKPGINLKVPCCGSCCCVDPGALEIRHRIWLFAFVLVGSMLVSVAVTVHAKTGLWAFGITTFCLMPAKCFLKARIVGMSNWGKQKFPFLSSPAVQFEDLLLIGMLVAGIYLIVHQSTVSMSLVFDSIYNWCYSFACIMVAEFFTLIYTYFFCRICCGCCMPTKRDLWLLHKSQKELTEPLTDETGTAYSGNTGPTAV